MKGNFQDKAHILQFAVRFEYRNDDDDGGSVGGVDCGTDHAGDGETDDDDDDDDDNITLVLFYYGDYNYS
jgi:hypothetical protein